jgi:hypothetical protein
MVRVSFRCRPRGRFDGEGGAVPTGPHGEGKGEKGKKWLELWKTDRGDVELVRDFVTEDLRKGSVGVRILLRGVERAR